MVCNFYINSTYHLGSGLASVSFRITNLRSVIMIRNSVTVTSLTSNHMLLYGLRAESFRCRFRLIRHLEIHFDNSIIYTGVSKK